jgi:hypothetical protein
VKDSSNARRWPDHDPVNSMPAIPLPVAAGVPDAVRERYDEPGELHEVLAQLDQALALAVDTRQPHRTSSRCSSVAVLVERAARGGPDSARVLVNDLARVAAGWRREQ